MTVPAWDMLGGLPAWRLTELPRVAPRGEDRNENAAELATEAAEDRMLALASACGEGSPVAFGWIREEAGGPVQVIAAGNGMRAEGAGAQAGSEGLMKLGYPAGARGVPLAPGGLGAAFDALPWWIPIAITPDALMAGDEKNPAPKGKPYGLGVLRTWDGPFGWLVLAVPAGDDRHKKLLDEASLAQLAAERHDSPRAQLSARRWKARHDELREAATHGLWDIWLLAGAADKRDLMRVAGLVSSSLHPRGMPFGLKRLNERQGRLPELLGAAAGAQAPPEPVREPGPRAQEVLGMYGQAPRPEGPGASRWTPGVQQQTDSNGFPAWAPTPDPGWAKPPQPASLVPEFPDPDPEFPVAASSKLLSALAVPPSREVPGVRFTLEPDFDVTPETADGTGLDEIPLGTILDSGRIPAGRLGVRRGSLNRHTFVCGATGAGKSQTVRHLLESATEAGIPWLVIEPAKAEYRLMGARVPGAEVVTIRPGDLATVPAGINPLEPAAGPDGTRFPLQAHADLVRALFLAAFQADEPFPQVLAQALQRCYAEAGWDLVTGECKAGGAGYPTLGDLQEAALKVVEEIGYSQEITDNVRGFVSVRIGSLRGGTTGQFLDGGFSLDYSRLLSGNVVLEIEDCGDDLDKAFLTGAVLVRLTEHLRMRSRAEAAAGGAAS
ncbi:MAG: ATP-binding protein, partial [Streptosporangiales bacterium]|nr:ATP-binding protein [Streptosporangiales bacterium]